MRLLGPRDLPKLYLTLFGWQFLVGGLVFAVLNAVWFLVFGIAGSDGVGEVLGLFVICAVFAAIGVGMHLFGRRLLAAARRL